MTDTIHPAWSATSNGERPYRRNTTQDTIGAMMIRLRAKYGLSQYGLGARMDTNHAHISRIEGGTRHPSREMVERMADALEVTPEEYDAMLTAAGYRVPDARIDPVLRLGEAKVLARFWQGADADEREKGVAA